MRTSNPALNAKTFAMPTTYSAEKSGVMTINGTVNKTAILLVLACLTATYTWRLFLTQGPAAVMPWLWGGLIGGLVMALVTVFKKTWAPVTAPVYALLEGLFLGGVSAFYSSLYAGIVFQAVGLTLGTLFMLLLAYRSGLIRATENFKLGVVAATGAILLIYVVSMVLRMFGTQIPLIHESGWVGVGFSLFVVVIAALNLVLDFDFIEQGAANRAPKYLEWYAGFGLMVTLVWLYLEMLRLLAKLRDR